MKPVKIPQLNRSYIFYLIDSQFSFLVSSYLGKFISFPFMKILQI